MSTFPNAVANDTDLPIINDNLSEIGGDVVNAIREEVIAIEETLGVNPQGTKASVADRLDVSIQPDGYIKSSVITAMGLVTLPINNAQVGNSAAIVESKLSLDHSTQSLFNSLGTVTSNINNVLNFMSTTGAKINPHIAGTDFKHYMSHINVDTYLRNNLGAYRDNTNLYTLTHGINTELLNHQTADGSKVSTGSITADNGDTFTNNFAHTAGGVHVNPSRFTTIPQTADDLQAVVDYIDNSSMILYGNRVKDLYSNGISRVSHSSTLSADGYGQILVPATTVTTFLLNTGGSSVPVDDIDHGDDIVEFKPLSGVTTNNLFDSQFNSISVGDTIKVNYGSAAVEFIVKEKKYISTVGSKKYIVRINGKNLAYSTTATAMVYKPLANDNKFNSLAVSAVNNQFSSIPSLLITNPRSAGVLSINFNPDLLDPKHYALYLAVYPTGLVADGYTLLSEIDVTGNQGQTPGKYTLENIVEAVNAAFRKIGYNYRFSAFAHKGEFGLSLTDPYHGASFSIVNGLVNNLGAFDQTATNLAFPNNVIDVFGVGVKPIDPLGLLSFSSPPYLSTFSSPEQAAFPTKIFVPLKRNNYYVNGAELEKLTLEDQQLQDSNGDGYWIASILSVSTGARVETTYRIPLNLSTSGLQIGKTIVIQSLGSGTIVDFGRYIISNINCTCGVSASTTDITVYDAVHSTGITPASTLSDGYVAVYFNSDSVGFNAENSSDYITSGTLTFKRHFEVYINKNSETFTHERARFNITGSTISVNTVNLLTDVNLNKINIVKVSDKLKGYPYGQINMITLRLSYNSTTGGYSGYLCDYNGASYYNIGQLSFGKIGDVTRFYDESNVDYIDFQFNLSDSISSFTNAVLDIQIFPTLSLDKDIMLLATCQLNDKTITNLVDRREFGNIGVKDLSTSTLNYISTPQRVLNYNGVVTGFDKQVSFGLTNPTNNQIYLKGGTALVNGKFIDINPQTVSIPLVQENYSGVTYNVNWALCLNDKGDFVTIPLLDNDTSVPTPTVSTRIFTAYNPNYSTSYVIEALVFNEIAALRKDLLPLYIVKSVVTPQVGLTPSTTVLTLKDVRRFSQNVDSFNTLKLATYSFNGSIYSGNYVTAESILSWLSYNGENVGSALLGNASETISNPIKLSFSNNVVIDGQNTGALTFTDVLTIGSNVTFKNITINIDSLYFNVLTGSTNVIFDNCKLNISHTDSFISSVAVTFENLTNVKFNNCAISVNYYGSLSAEDTFYFSNCSNVEITNSSFSVTYFNSPALYYPAYILNLDTCSKVKINSNTFSGNFRGALYLSKSNNVDFKKNTLTSTYNPGLGPDLGFSSSNLVNYGQGYVRVYITDSSTYNLNIEDCVFTYNPEAISVNRFSFISIELTTITSNLKNVRIVNNSFNSTKASPGLTTDDFRSAISIINTNTSTSSNVLPTIENVTISNNFCDRNQGILITSTRATVSTTSTFSYPLAAKNVVVSNNNCGFIGYWVSNSNRIAQTLSTASPIMSDKDTNLSILNNNCHIIAAMDSNAKVFIGRKNATYTDVSTYHSGNVTIANNVANWISTSIAQEDFSTLVIDSNRLTSYDYTYCELYDFNATTVAKAYAITVGCNNYIVSTASANSETSCIISNNTINSGNWDNSSFNNYLYGGILTNTSVKIINNIIKGIQNTFSRGIDVCGMTSIITGNSIYRNGAEIRGYIYYNSLKVPVPGTALSLLDISSSTNGIVTNNFFDSPHINDGTTSESAIATSGLESIETTCTLPSNWVYNSNRNQTGYALISLGDRSLATNGNIKTFPEVAPPTSDVLELKVVGMTDNLVDNLIVIKHTNGSVGDSTARSIDIPISIAKYVPNNTSIIFARLGVRNTNSIIKSPGFVKLSIQDTSSANHVAQSANLNYLTYVTLVGLWSNTYVSSIASATLTSSQINANSNTTNYLDIDLSSSPKVLDSYQATTFTLHAEWQLATGNALDMVFSPLIVKYRW